MTDCSHCTDCPGIDLYGFSVSFSMVSVHSKTSYNELKLFENLHSKPNESSMINRIRLGM